MSAIEKASQKLSSDFAWLAREFDAVELGHELFTGAPRIASHPPFMYAMTEGHTKHTPMSGQYEGVTGASDAFSMGAHAGTHIDALNHIAFKHCLHDSTNVSDPDVEDMMRGIKMKSGPAMKGFAAPGVLLDFPMHFGVDVLTDTQGIEPEDILACAKRQGVSINRGDVVLVRTGRDRLFPDFHGFGHFPVPGPTARSARLLVELGVVATGSDTLTYEQAPGERPLEVHAELIAKNGIYIMEALNLSELAKRKAYRFGFVVAPLRIVGGTGSPVNPIALVDRG